MLVNTSIRRLAQRVAELVRLYNYADYVMWVLVDVKNKVLSNKVRPLAAIYLELFLLFLDDFFSAFLTFFC